jgi:hypothetical protein
MNINKIIVRILIISIICAVTMMSGCVEEEIRIVYVEAPVTTPVTTPTYIEPILASHPLDIDSIEGIVYDSTSGEVIIRTSLEVGGASFQIENLRSCIGICDHNADRVGVVEGHTIEVIRDEDNSIGDYGIVNRGDLFKVIINTPKNVFSQNMTVALEIDGHYSPVLSIRR